jgi:phosphoribosylaminoimidazole-succinocarboxamide synthase
MKRPRVHTRQPHPIDLPIFRRGKVRDVYEVGSERLLMVASDRVSAFDVVLPQPIPRKGEVLTQITVWWLGLLARELDLRHHLITADDGEIVAAHPELERSREAWSRRAMLVHRTDPVLVECVVRGYLSGSAWREYRDTGTLAGEPLPDGLRESDRLDPPIFSPATKAQEGHDENITYDQVVDVLGAELASELRSRSLEIYEFGRETLRAGGIILADTKFEFGLDRRGTVVLIDEVMTPDSSRFWPVETWEPGRGQPSLDKQPIRDWLDALDDWDKQPPPPDLPDGVVDAASSRYLEAFRRVTGTELDDWTPPRAGSDA